MVWKITCLKFSYIEVYSVIVAFAVKKKKAQGLLGIIALCKGSVHNYANYANELFQNVFCETNTQFQLAVYITQHWTLVEDLANIFS